MKRPNEEKDFWIAELLVSAIIAIALCLIYAGYQAADVFFK